MMNIVSSNIRFANDLDGDHSWENRKELLAETFNDLDIDFLGTQEGRKDQILELDGLLKNLSLIHRHREWIADRMYPSLFFNPKKYRALISKDIWLSKTPQEPGSSSFESAFPRLMNMAVFEDLKSKQKITIVNTHLDHILPMTREKQIEVLVSELKKEHHSPQIIMGDFNENPQSTIKKFMMNEFNLKDPWEVNNLPEETSHHGFQGNKAQKGERIDWILIDSKWKCDSIYLEKKCVDGIYLSDHYPLVATVIPK